MDDLYADGVTATERDRRTAIELDQDELEHVVGGLQRTWIKPPTDSDTTTVESGEGATPVSPGLVK